jgi:hypothetical protein
LKKIKQNITLSFTALILLSFSLNSCVKDRFEDGIDKNPNDTTSIQITAGIIKINEIQAAGNVNQNEFGELADWIEIYNPTLNNITLAKGKWWITDDAFNNQKKYQIPVSITIPALGFWVVWCDNRDTFANDVHTNFALSSSGEDIGLYYENNDGNLIEIDIYSYPPQQGGTSIGRFPDGSDNWQVFSIPTPGQPNN